MPLLEDDETYLRGKGWKFGLTEEPGRTLLVIKDYRLPPRFTLEQVDMLIVIPALYPTSQLDMFWVRPEVRLRHNNAYPQAANYFEEYIGQRWQRFSRHYPWRSGVDSLESHLKVVQKSLETA